MKITVLIENDSLDEELCHQHGLSLYIETENNKILFDTGQDDSFISNAEKLGINLADVDITVISHGHYDHGGGLNSFLKINQKSKIYISRKAFEKYYYYNKEQEEQYIGLDISIDKERMIWIDEYLEINKDIMIISEVKGDFLSPITKLFKTDESGEGVADDFSHEINMLIKENDRYTLFCGCAHTGLFNIIRKAKTYIRNNIYTVIGGFHLMKLSREKAEDRNFLDKFADELSICGVSKYYTGHCTGKDNNDFLQTKADNLYSIQTGTVIKL